MFSAWKLIKLFITANSDSQFVALIRPTDYNNEKKLDMLIFNQDWELEGITSNL